MNHKITNWFSVVFFALLGIFYIVYIYNYAVNFPYLDDTSLIDFLFQVTKKNATWNTFFGELFRSDNDHCLAVPRLITLIEYWINGTINFKHFIFIINFLIFVILYFLYIEFKHLKLPLFYFLPVVLFWLQPQYYEIQFWALTGMQHTILTVFVLLIINFLSSKKRSLFITAIVLGLLATFTHGNGILCFPAGLFVLIIQGRFKESLYWIVSMFATLMLYLISYKASGSASLAFDIIKVAESFFAFIGANQSVYAFKMVFLSVIWGVIITGFLGYLILKNIWQVIFQKKINQNPEMVKLLALFCFVIFTSGIIALMRSWLGVTLTSRYQSYAAISSIIFYLVALSSIKNDLKAYFGGAFFFFALFFNINSYHKYTQDVDSKAKMLSADIFNWKQNRTMFCVPLQFIRNAQRFTEPSYNQKMWQIAFPYGNIEKALLQPVEVHPKANPCEIKFEKLIEAMQEKNGVWYKYFLKIHNDDIQFVKKNGKDALFLIFKEETINKTYLIATTSKIASRRELFSGKTFDYFKQGFTSIFPITNLDNGNYRLGYVTITESKTTIQFTDKTISIPYK